MIAQLKSQELEVSILTFVRFTRLMASVRERKLAVKANDVEYFISSITTICGRVIVGRERKLIGSTRIICTKFPDERAKKTGSWES